MAESGSLSVLRGNVETFLRASYGDVPRDSDGDYVVRREGVVTWVRPLALTEEQTAVVVWSTAAVDVRVDAALTGFLATEGNNLSFGQFELHRSPDRIHISHALLGEFLSGEELTVAVDAVNSAAGHYGPIIAERFGGGRAPASTPSVTDEQAARAILNLLVRSSARRVPASKVLQTVFGLIGLAVGVVGGIYAHRRTSSWALGAFVLVVASYVIGRGVADVITDPNKVRRALYFTIPPAAATGVLSLTFRWWDRWWLAVLLGLTVGVLIGTVVAMALFPHIAREEMEDDRERRRRFLRG